MFKRTGEPLQTSEENIAKTPRMSNTNSKIDTNNRVSITQHIDKRFDEYFETFKTYLEEKANAQFEQIKTFIAERENILLNKINNITDEKKYLVLMNV